MARVGVRISDSERIACIHASGRPLSLEGLVMGGEASSEWSFVRKDVLS